MSDNLSLTHLRALHAAADQSEWEVRTDIGCICSLSGLAGDIVCDMPNEYPSKKNWQSNAESIAAIHNAFPALLDRLEAAEREREELRAVIKREHEAARLRREAGK